MILLTQLTTAIIIRCPWWSSFPSKDARIQLGSFLKKINTLQIKMHNVASFLKLLTKFSKFRSKLTKTKNKLIRRKRISFHWICSHILKSSCFALFKRPKLNQKITKRSISKPPLSTFTTAPMYFPCRMNCVSCKIKLTRQIWYY